MLFRGFPIALNIIGRAAFLCHFGFRQLDRSHECCRIGSIAWILEIFRFLQGWKRYSHSVDVAAMLYIDRLNTLLLLLLLLL